MRHRLQKALKIVSIAMLVLGIGIINGANVSAKNDNNTQKKNENQNIEQNIVTVAFVDKQVEDTMYNQKQSVQRLSTVEDKIPEEDDTYIETDTAAEGAAAKWVNGVAVPMSKAEIEEFLEELYACQTQEEYEDMLKTLAYLNGGIDLSPFEWYWESLDELYSDEQIAIMRTGKREWKEVPNVVGMEAMEAYKYMLDRGFLARLNYYYDPDSDLPVDYCYAQEIAPGTLWNTDASIILSIQAPYELLGVSVNRDPDDENFNFDKEIFDQHDINYVPNVVGMTESDALRALEDAGFYNINVYYDFNYTDTPVGICTCQDWPAGEARAATGWMGIYIQSEPPMLYEIPNVIGLSESDACNQLWEAGFRVQPVYEYDPDSSQPVGMCMRQSHTGNHYDSYLLITIYIQIENPNPTPEPPEEPQQTPAPESSPEPSAELTPEPPSETAPEPSTEPSTEPIPQPSESTDDEGQAGE